MKTLGAVLSIILFATSCGRIVSGLKNQLRSSIATPVNQTLGIHNSTSDSSQVNQNNSHIFSVKEALAEKFGF